MPPTVTGNERSRSYISREQGIFGKLWGSKGHLYNISENFGEKFQWNKETNAQFHLSTPPPSSSFSFFSSLLSLLFTMMYSTSCVFYYFPFHSIQMYSIQIHHRWLRYPVKVEDKPRLLLALSIEDWSDKRSLFPFCWVQLRVLLNVAALTNTYAI